MVRKWLARVCVLKWLTVLEVVDVIEGAARTSSVTTVDGMDTSAGSVEQTRTAAHEIQKVAGGPGRDRGPDHEIEAARREPPESPDPDPAANPEIDHEKIHEEVHAEINDQHQKTSPNLDRGPARTIDQNPDQNQSLNLNLSHQKELAKGGIALNQRRSLLPNLDLQVQP